MTGHLLALGPFARCVDGRRCGSGSCVRGFLAQGAGQSGDGGVLEQEGDGKFATEGGAQLLVHLYNQKRVTAEIEKVVLAPDGGGPVLPI